MYEVHGRRVGDAIGSSGREQWGRYGRGGQVNCLASSTFNLDLDSLFLHSASTVAAYSNVNICLALRLRSTPHSRGSIMSRKVWAAHMMFPKNSEFATHCAPMLRPNPCAFMRWEHVFPMSISAPNPG